jgi:hypothetical protein
LISTLKRAQDAAQKLRVHSALNPFLWLCGISTPTLLGSALLFEHSESLRRLCAPLTYVALAIPLVTLVVGVGFAIVSPDKLQSEEYQIRQQALLMFQQMGAAPQLIDPSNIVAIANPAVERAASPAEAN